MTTTHYRKNAGSRMNDDASPAQIGFVKSLYEGINALLPKASTELQQAVIGTITPVAQTMAQILATGAVTKSDASRVITVLKAAEIQLAPVKKAQQAVAALASVAEWPHLGFADRIIPNKFGKECTSCRNWVETGEGLAVHSIKTGQHYGWTTWCKDCASGKGSELADATKALRQRIVTATGSMTKDGAIRIVLPGASVGVDNSEAAYRVGLDSPGVQRHVGGPGSVAVHPVGTPKAIEIINMLLALNDAELLATQAAYGQHFHSCGRCGSPLSDDHSKAIGLGPDCARKGY